MGSLIEFLKRETAVNALEKSIKHAQLVQECVKTLDIGINVLLNEKNPEKADPIFEKVDTLERDADELRREIQKDISKGELNPSVRQNLSHLIKRMDDVANCCVGVARRITTITFKFWEQSSDNTIRIVLGMMENTVKAVELLDKLVVDLLGQRKQVKEFAKQVNYYEHEVDLLNIKLRKSLDDTKYDVNYFTAFTAGNVFDIIEAISDSIEAVADYIMVLLTSSENLK
jgi:predicted phosphate transport protein (TIGR00153 family)